MVSHVGGSRHIVTRKPAISSITIQGLSFLRKKFSAQLEAQMAKKTVATVVST